MRLGVRRFGIVVALSVLGAASCHRDPPPRVRLKNVHQCEDGVHRALAERNRTAALQVFYGSCANLFVELPCRNAVARAAKQEEADQLPSIVEACRKAYCPIGKGVAACGADFAMKAGELPVVWHELSGAILQFDAGAYLPIVQQILYEFSAGMATVPPAPPAPPAASASAG